MVDPWLQDNLRKQLLSFRSRGGRNVDMFVQGKWSYWHFVDSSQWDAENRRRVRVLELLIVRVSPLHRNQGVFADGWRCLREILESTVKTWERLRVQSIKNDHLYAFLCKQPGAQQHVHASTGCRSVDFSARR